MSVPFIQGGCKKMCAITIICPDVTLHICHSCLRLSELRRRSGPSGAGLGGQTGAAGLVTWRVNRERAVLPSHRQHFVSAYSFDQRSTQEDTSEAAGAGTNNDYLTRRETHKQSSAL